MTSSPAGPPTWSAPVRYVEVDGQGVVFNGHYLTYCDEAFGAFCAGLGLAGFAEQVRLKTSTQTWAAPLTFGDTVEVRVRCTGVGRTSTTIAFSVGNGTSAGCEVTTVYVLADDAGRPVALPEAVRTALLATGDA